MAETRIRLRLQGLLDCWYVVPSGLARISDVCSDILAAFDLYKTYPDGICLFMDGFLLPPTQPLTLLTDKDLISVQPKRVDAEKISSCLRTSNDCGSCDSVSVENSVSSTPVVVLQRKQAGAEQHVNAVTCQLTRKRKNKDRSEADHHSSTITHCSKKGKVATVPCGKPSAGVIGVDSCESGSLLPNKRPTLGVHRIPKSPWLSFAVLLQILSTKLCYTDAVHVQHQYSEYKRGKISREGLVRNLKDIAGEKTLKQAIFSMQPQVRCGHDFEHGKELAACEERGNVTGGNSTIMPKT